MISNLFTRLTTRLLVLGLLAFVAVVGAASSSAAAAEDAQAWPR